MVGQCPEWYKLIRAARYLGVPSWELARQPVWWVDVAIIAEEAEAEMMKHANSSR
jgi:hypothetical protein